MEEKMIEIKKGEIGSERKGKCEETAKGCRVLCGSGRNKNILKLEFGNGYITMTMLIPLNCTLRMSVWYINYISIKLLKCMNKFL